MPGVFLKFSSWKHKKSSSPLRQRSRQSKRTPWPNCEIPSLFNREVFHSWKSRQTHVKNYKGTATVHRNADRKTKAELKQKLARHIKNYKKGPINRCNLEITQRFSVSHSEGPTSSRTNGVTKPPLLLKLKLDICVNLIK